MRDIGEINQTLVGWKMMSEHLSVLFSASKDFFRFFLVVVDLFGRGFFTYIEN